MQKAFKFRPSSFDGVEIWIVEIAPPLLPHVQGEHFAR